MNPVEKFQKYFRYDHLPPHLAEVSKPFCDLYQHILQSLPVNAETTTSVRKLLEAKDCAVRSVLPD